MDQLADPIEFGPFRLDAAHRTLWRGDAMVPLSSRAFDILQLLVEHRGRVVSKDEIMSSVWRGMIVEENNLAVQVSALRRALAEGSDVPVILTVPGQGYRFVGDIARRAAPPEPQPMPHAEAANAAAASASPHFEAGVPPQMAAPAVAAPAPANATSGNRWLYAASAVLLVVAVVTWLRPVPAALQAPPPPASPAAPPPRLSIAVLPFRDLSDDRCCDYLADAISDDITTELSHIPGSVVIARESSDAFRGKSMPTAEIGRALSVRYLLEGSLRAVEGQFSINAQLIEAATGGHLWAERFMVPRAKLGEAQETIVQRLASALDVKLVDIEGTRAAGEHADNQDALDLFLRARPILHRGDNLAALNQAQGLLEQAVAKQPDFSPALAELAWLLPRKASGAYYPRRADDMAEARQVGAQALRLTPNAAMALAARGALLAYDGQCATAQASFAAALTTEPDNIPARTGLVVCLTDLGRFEEAVPRLQDLLRLDPEGPRNKVRSFDLGYSLVMLGRPKEAIAWLDRATAGDAEPVPGADDLGRQEWTRLYQIAAYQMEGETAKARIAYATYARVWPNRTAWRLGAEFTKAQTAGPGFRAFLDALVQAGMPQTVYEHTDWKLPPATTIVAHRAFEPTPMTVPGSETLDTDGVKRLLAANPAPRFVNVGSQAVQIAGTDLCTFDPMAQSEVAACAANLRAATQPVVVMGASALDWRGYNAVLALAGAGVAHARWYRGGEEAWAAAGGASADGRPQ